MNEEPLPDKRGRGRPPKPIVKTSRKDLADNAKFWLSLATLRTNPLTKKKEILSELDFMNLKMIAKAKAGNVNAYNAVLDRAFGKPKQYSEVDLNHKGTIVAFQWAGDALPEGVVVPEPRGEEIQFEPVDMPDEEVQDFESETEKAE
jgi:hypothetical protein